MFQFVGVEIRTDAIPTDEQTTHIEMGVLSEEVLFQQVGDASSWLRLRIEEVFDEARRAFPEVEFQLID